MAAPSGGKKRGRRPVPSSLTIRAAAATVLLLLLPATIALSISSTSSASSARPTSPSLWEALDPAARSPPEAFHAVFGARGERGEYMDGYAPQAMAARCIEDYGWAADSTDDQAPTSSMAGGLASRRAEMMAGLYEADSTRLWRSVSLVAFAEQYVLAGKEDEDEEGCILARPFAAFQRQRDARPLDEPIFGGAVLHNWEGRMVSGGDGIQQSLTAFSQRGVDYVRLECNFGEAEDIGGAARLTEDSAIRDRFGRLAEAARECQRKEMVPLVLMQVPWREAGGASIDYYARAVHGFAAAARDAGVESRRLLLETRPPVGVSAREEKDLDGAARISLGLQTGRKMFEIIEDAFGGDTIAGFCVAGGSTKGDNPTAMEDDTQNAVRQGIRQSAKRSWGYEMCFWEMGAKLMLQPKVGQLWGKGQSGRDAACELFCANAEALSEEIASEEIGTNIKI